MPIQSNSTQMTLRAALADYLKAYDFGKTPGGYDDRWAKVIFGKVALTFPNIQARRQAVKIHDVNHILTGYPPIVFEGEIQIAFYELGASCGKYWFAWFINLIGVPFGLRWPKKSWAAFWRGRKTRSLYHHPEWIEEHLDQPVQALQKRVGLV